MNQEKKEVIENIKKAAKEIAGLGGKSVTAKMPTIWEKDKYKVHVDKEKYERHKEEHLHILVSKGDESGNIAISNGEPLNGNLSRKTINWCKETLLNKENKARILKMIESGDYYRLDRKNEVNNHPM